MTKKNAHRFSLGTLETSVFKNDTNIIIYELNCLQKEI